MVNLICWVAVHMQIPEREKFAVCDSVVYHKMWYYVIDYIGHHGCTSGLLSITDLEFLV